MFSLRNFLDNLHPLFVKGGRFEKLYAVYEAVDTFFYTPADVTRTAPHVRDGIDLKRVMIYVWFATLPIVVMACWNIGYQANTALQTLGLADGAPGWRGDILAFLGSNFNPDSFWDNFWHGFWYFLPVYAVTFLVGGFWLLVGFAIAEFRQHQ